MKWWSRQGAVIATAAAAAVVLAAPGRAAGSSITYTVESDSNLSTVAYFNEFNIQRQLSDVSSPWTTSFDTDPASQILIVAATTTGQHVSCSISVDGTVRDHESAEGPGAEVHCRAQS